MLLNGFWDFAFIDELENCNEPVPVDFPDKLPVPGCFDVEPGYRLRRGIGIYRTFVFLGGDAVLTLEGLGPKGSVYWDGKIIGKCELPFSEERFHFHAGQLRKHELRIVIDNRADDSPDSLFPGFYDFYRHGGIYRSISIEGAPLFDIAYVRVLPQSLERGTAEISVELSGGFPAESEILFRFDKGEAVSEKILDGKGTWLLSVPNCRLWSPDHPELHELTVTVSGREKRVTFGMRTIESRDGLLFLNGSPLKLLGYNRHDCHPDFGYAMPEVLVRRDLEMIRRQGCNFIRGCHYPQSETVLSWCDRLGLLVWEESLGWGNDEKNLDNADFCRKQREQTRRMARKSINHPCVILHGFMNELKSSLPSAKELVRSLAGILRSEDPSRPVTYACNLPFEDISLSEVDVVSFNIYPGWYVNRHMSDVQEFDLDGFENALKKYESLLQREDLIHKPYVISEIGSAALPGFHGEVRWSEEYQARLAEAVFRHVLTSSRCSGLALWMFCDTRTYNDFRATRRPRGFNNKGVLDEYRRPKMAWNAIGRFLEANRNDQYTDFKRK